MIGLLEQVGPRDILAAGALLTLAVTLGVLYWCWPEAPSLRVVSGRFRRMRLSIGARRDNMLIPYVPFRIAYSIRSKRVNFPSCDPHPYDWKKREPMIWTQASD